MAVETALVTYLAAALPAETIVEGPMAESPANQMHVAHYDSMEAEDRVMSGSLVNQQAVWPSMVQVMVRDTDKATAYSRAYAAWLLLDNYSGTLGGVTYHSIEADGEPVNLFKDGNERWRFSFNVTVRKQRG